MPEPVYQEEERRQDEGRFAWRHQDGFTPRMGQVGA